MELNGNGTPTKWNGDDWEYYKTLMLNVFMENDLEDIVSSDTLVENATAEQIACHNKKQAKVKRIILSSLAIPLAHRVMKSESGTVMWNKLCEIHEGFSNPVIRQQRQRLMVNELWNTKLERGASASSHLQKLLDIRDKLAVQQYIVHDIDMVEIILESLPNSFEYNELKRTVRYATTTYTSDNLKELVMIAENKTKEVESRHSVYKNNAKGHYTTREHVKPNETTRRGLIMRRYVTSVRRLDILRNYVQRDQKVSTK